MSLKCSSFESVLAYFVSVDKFCVALFTANLMLDEIS